MTINLKADELTCLKRILANVVPDVDAWIFGSRAIGNAQVYSDLDLLLKADKKIPLNMMSLLSERFADSDLPFKVDIVDWYRIDSEFQNHIKQHAVRL